MSKIPVPGGTEGIAVSPDGMRVIVMAHTEPGLVVIDPATDAIVDRIAIKVRRPAPTRPTSVPTASDC